MSEFVNMLENILPEGWAAYDPHMGNDCLLECPCGSVIEQDGTCPEGCVSPLIGLGLI